MASPGDSAAWPCTIAASCAATSPIRVEPVSPHTKARPKRKIALENEPSRKYLMAPSVESASRLWKPASR